MAMRPHRFFCLRNRSGAWGQCGVITPMHPFLLSPYPFFLLSHPSFFGMTMTKAFKDPLARHSPTWITTWQINWNPFQTNQGNNVFLILHWCIHRKISLLSLTYQSSSEASWSSQHSQYLTGLQLSQVVLWLTFDHLKTMGGLDLNLFAAEHIAWCF